MCWRKGARHNALALAAQNLFAQIVGFRRMAQSRLSEADRQRDLLRHRHVVARHNCAQSGSFPRRVIACLRLRCRSGIFSALRVTRINGGGAEVRSTAVFFLTTF